MTDLIAKLVAHLRGMWRFRWWALLGSWLMCMAGFAWVYTLPNMYESSTRVYVDTQTALKDAIKGLGNASDVREEVQKKLSEMISIPNLKKVARDTDMDLRATTPLAMEKLVDRLRSTIEIRSLKDNSLYSITYRDTDPAMAQRVVQTMLSDFVGDALRENNKDTTDAMRFLEEQIATYEKRLLEAEKGLSDFKKENVGLMPGSEGDYYQRLEAANGRVQALQAQYRLKLSSRNELRAQIAGEEPTFGILRDGAGTPSPSGATAADAQIDALRVQLAQQQLRLTDRHPDVIDTIETIAALEAQRDAELAQRQPVAQDRPAFNPLDQNPVYQDMKIQLSRTEVELVQLSTSLREAERAVANLKRLVDQVPEVEAQLSRLNRDYGVTKSFHNELLDRLESARLGEDANAQSDDIKFQVIDPPLLPLDPTGPNRPLFLTAILFASLAFGLAVSFLLDQLKPVFSTRKELISRTGLPVLGSIGVVLMPHQRVSMRLQTAAFALGLLALVGAYVGVISMEDKFVEIASGFQGRTSL
ncbi:MAG: XrtA system polysaccharide chain length determinant [Gammaproteobacteria bacterium]